MWLTSLGLGSSPVKGVNEENNVCNTHKQVLIKCQHHLTQFSAHGGDLINIHFYKIRVPVKFLLVLQIRDISFSEVKDKSVTG